MTTVADILCAIERRAERALVQELRLMTREILDLRFQLTLGDRAHADALLLKLDHLERCQQVAPVASADPPPPPAHALHLADLTRLQPTGWLVHFYSHDAGDLEQVVLAESFATAVQCVRNRLDDAERAVVEVVRETTGSDISMLASDGVVFASIHPCVPVTPPIDPEVRSASTAFERGDLAALAGLFVRERAAA